MNRANAAPGQWKRGLLAAACLGLVVLAACSDRPDVPPAAVVRPAPAVAPIATAATTSWFQPRSLWTKAAVDVANTKPLGTPWRITIHHSGQSADAARPGQEILPLIERIHRAKLWACIGYHFIIDGQGNIWEGRPLTFQGAHAGDDERNRGNVGICLLGDFEQRPASPAQMIALNTVVTRIRTQFRIPRTDVKGHLEVKPSTECPGKFLLTHVQRYRRLP